MFRPPVTDHELGQAPVYITPEAEGCISPAQLWHHLGGFWDEGDTYDTQEAAFASELDRFWADLIGPDEHVQAGILRILAEVRPRWRSVVVSADGTVRIHFADGSVKTLGLPKPRKHPDSPD